MRFYMIDRVISYDPWKSIHAQKLTSRNEIGGWAGAGCGCLAGVGSGQGGAGGQGQAHISANLGARDIGPREGDRKGRDGVNPSTTHLRDARVERCVDEGLVPSRPLRASSPPMPKFAPMGPAQSPRCMPSALVLEALCQAGSWLLLLSSGLRQRAALLSIGSVTYIREVELGAVLEIEGHVIGGELDRAPQGASRSQAAAHNEMAVFSGRVLVEGIPVLEASEIMCVLIDAQELEDPLDTARMKHLLLQGGEES